MDVGKQTWGSCIPLHITLASDEVTSLETPASIYVLVPRHWVLPAVAADVKHHFAHVLPPGEDRPWFDYNGLPLWWQLPAGVLYDLLSSGMELPWPLKVHYRAFPHTLPTFEGEPSLRANFFNALKEACFIIRGNSNSVMQMVPEAQDELWDSLKSRDEEVYSRVLGSLTLDPRARGDRGLTIPLRLLIRLGNRGGYLSSYEDIHYTSRPVATVKEDSSPATLQDVVSNIVREYLDRGPGQNSRGNGDSSSSNRVETGDGKPTKLQAGHNMELDIIIAGIQPPLDTPIGWLHEHMRAPDYFLYGVVHASSGPS